MESNNHISVLLHEAVEALDIKPDGIYVDGTLGRGGHSQLILDKLNEHGRLISIDQDIQAIQYCTNNFKNDSRIRIIKNNFSNIDKILNDLKIDHVDGILLDLGVSSPQIDNPERGFSFKQNCALDMRMDLDNALTAEYIINNYSFQQLSYIFKVYADEHNPSRLVNAILKERTKHPIKTSFELNAILKTVLPKKEIYTNHNFSNKYFQALRIAVNDEINALEQFLARSVQFLNKDGRLCIITFHSLEDRIVQNCFKQLSKNKLPKEIPLNQQLRDFEIVNFKGITPTKDEVNCNIRSRSSKLRILKKVAS